MKIHVLPSGPIQTNGYLVTHAESGAAVLIDAPGGILDKVNPLLAREKCVLRELWLTHGHWDHMQDGAKVRQATGARVRAHLADRDLIETPQKMEEFMGARLGLEAVPVAEWVEGGTRFEALGCDVEVRHVPGHCPGNVLFWMPALQAAFVGDALFNGGVGRWDLPGGDFDVLARSIRSQIYTLPEETVVFPGHGPRTTVGAEKETNPFVPQDAAPTSG